MRLTYGSLDLTDHPYGIQFGSDFGAPQNVTEALAFLLQDGEVELSSRASNRTIQFNVLIEGGDLGALADAEAALIAETEKPLNELTLDPEDYGPPTVFETFRAQVTHARDDDGELSRLRLYTVTVKALPFGHSEAEVVTEALAASGTTTELVDDGSATTNWTGEVNGVSTAPTVDSGAVKVTTGTGAVVGDYTLTLTRTDSIDTTVTKYLAVDWKPESDTGGPDLRAFADGVELARIGEQASPSAGYTRTYFLVPSAVASIAALRLESSTSISPAGTPPGVGSGRSLYVDNIDRTDVRPKSGTARQLLRSLDVGGSVRTPGSLAIEHETAALGDVIVYVYPDVENVRGYSPPLRQYRVSGPTVTPDASLVSGLREDLTGATAVFDVPRRCLASGQHLLVVRTSTGALLSPTPVLSWTAVTRINGSDVGPTESGSCLITSSDLAYYLWAAGRVVLPTVDVDPAASTAVVRISLSVTAPATVEFDEAWLFNLSIGRFAQIPCGAGAGASGGPARRVFMEPATPLRPRPTVRIGHAADRSDSYYPTGVFWQMPQFQPGRNHVFTVTTNAEDAAVSLRNFDRWHTNAAG